MQNFVDSLKPLLEQIVDNPMLLVAALVIVACPVLSYFVMKLLKGAWKIGSAGVSLAELGLVGGARGMSSLFGSMFGGPWRRLGLMNVGGALLFGAAWPCLMYPTENESAPATVAHGELSMREVFNAITNESDALHRRGLTSEFLTIYKEQLLDQKTYSTVDVTAITPVSLQSRVPDYPTIDSVPATQEVTLEAGANPARTFWPIKLLGSVMLAVGCSMIAMSAISGVHRAVNGPDPYRC